MEWLRNKEYNTVLQARKKPLGEWRRHPDLELMLAERQKTQAALDQLGVTRETAPKDVPYMERWTKHTQPTQPSDRRIIEFAGMPACLKSHMLIRHAARLSSSRQEKLAVVPDGGEYLRKKFSREQKHKGPWQYHIQLENFSLVAVLDAFHLEKKQHVWKEHGELSALAHRRAHFLAGETPYMHSASEENIAIYHLNPAYSAYDNGQAAVFPIHTMVMTLVRPPFVEQRREKRYNPERLNLWWNVYEQFLRLHQEITSGKIHVPNYICLDMECGLDEARDKWTWALKTVEQLTFEH